MSEINDDALEQHRQGQRRSGFGEEWPDDDYMAEQEILRDEED